MFKGVWYAATNLVVSQISHSIGFSGRQMGSYVEGRSARDFPLIHDA